MRVWAIWSVKSGSLGNTRLLSRAKMLLVSLRTADVSPGSSPLRDVSRNVPQRRWARRNACRRSQASCLFQWIHVFSLTGGLCSGGVYVLTEQTMWFLPPVFMLACSQTLYFLFKVRRARVIKYGPQGIYDVFEKNEKKNKTTSVTG